MRRALAQLVPWLLAVGGTAAVTAAGYAMELNANTMGFAFLIVVLLSAVRGGLLAGAAASVIATLCYNFFFFSPLHTFTIAEPANWLALSAFLVTSVIVSRLVIAARIQAEDAERRRNELETLYGLSVDLFAATDDLASLGKAAGRALTLLGARGGGLVLFDRSPYRQHVVWWTGEKPDELEDVIAGVGRHQEPLEIPSAEGRDVHLPLLVGGETAGALVARGTSASMHALVSASGLVSLAVERRKFMEENARMHAIRESDALKTSLLRAISHDLTTPLTSITIRTETLRRKAESDDELRASVQGIAGETARLLRRINNLLAMARLEAGKAKPHPEPTPPADLFRSVREHLPVVFESRPVTIHVDADCPDAHVDPSLALEILVNLVENAHRVSPAGAPVELSARALDGARVRLEVLDRGPGIPPDVADAGGNLLGGATSDLPQRGLGLEIARSLAAASGGGIGLMPRPGGGTIARVDLPAASMPALDTEES